ncbi:MAG: hypothetical protein ACYCVE_08425 [Gemmatimonadaceae bacterium]
MRSPAEVARATAEWILRGAAVAVLVWFLVWSIRAQRQGPTESAASSALGTQLARWSTVDAPSRVYVRLDHPPAARNRDWLSAMDGAGTAVSWRGPKLVATAVSLDPLADPQGGVDVNVAAPESAFVILADTVGVLDSARAGATGVRLYVPKPRATVDAIVGPVDARASRHDTLDLKRLFVVGAAGWEAKFVIAALEERGWKVDAHLAVSPRGDADRGNVAGIDTSGYSAVLAIDTVAARYARSIAKFVHEGGGLVLWSPAAKVSALAALAPGAPGALIQGADKSPPDSAPRSVLALVPITSLASDAVPLERRGDAVALAARRVGVGRVVETGYTDTWRWRMGGGVGALARYTDWVARLVSMVAYAPRRAIAAAPSDVAPLATLIDKLGPATPANEKAPLDPTIIAKWVFAFLCAAFLIEWASRRLRGVK